MKKVRKEVKIGFKEDSSGLAVKFNNKNYGIIFPRAIWKSYSRKIKDVWIDNFAHLSTICLPSVAEVEEVEYNTSLPVFKPFFHRMVLNCIPAATEDYAISTKKAIKQFKLIKSNLKTIRSKNLHIKVQAEALEEIKIGQ